MEDNELDDLIKGALGATEKQQPEGDDTELSALISASLGEPDVSPGKKKEESVSESAVTEFQFKEIDIEEIQANLYDGYFEERAGVRGPIQAAKIYGEAKKKGLSEIEAAREAGMPIVQEETEQGVVERINPPQAWRDMKDDAELYVKDNMAGVVHNRVSQNIVSLKQNIDRIRGVQEKSQEDYKALEDARKNLGKQILLRRQYGFMEGASPEELKTEVGDISAMISSDAKFESKPGLYGTMAGADEMERRQGQTARSLENIAKLSQKLDSDSIFAKDKNIGDYTGQFYLYDEAKAIMGEVNAIVSKSEDPDGFVPSVWTGLAGRFSGIYEGLEKGANLATDGTVRQARSGRSKALEATYEKFRQVSNGKMEIEDLTDAESALYLATVSAGESMEVFAERIPLSTEIGEQVGNALGFIAEIAMTGGTVAGVRTAAKQIVLKKLATSGAPSLLAKTTAGAVGALSQATIQTSVMPSTFTAMIDRYSHGESIPSAMYNGYLDNYGDVLASAIFTTPVAGPVMAKSGLTSSAQKFWARTNTMYGSVNGAKSFMDASLKEFTEEQFAAAFHAVRGAESFSDVMANMPSVRDQIVIGITTTGFASAGAIGNASNKISTKLMHNNSGKKLGVLRENIDMVLGDPDINTGQALLAINEVVDQSGLDDAGKKDAFEAAIRYMSADKVIKSWDEKGPTPQSKSIVDGQFEDAVVAGDVLQNGDGFVIRHNKEGDQESIALSQKVNGILSRFASGDVITYEDMVMARDVLATMDAFITDPNNKKTVKLFLDDLNEVTADMQPTSKLLQEIKQKPHLSVTKAELPVNDGEVVQAQMRVDVGDKQRGYAQQVQVDGQTKYNFYSTDKKLVGQYDSGEALNSAIKETVAKSSARRIKKDIVNEGSPKEYVADLRKRLNKMAKRTKVSDPLEALNAKREVADAMDTFKKRGKVSSEQVAAVTKYMAKVDMSRPDARADFMDYTEAVIQDGENIHRIDNRSTRRKAIGKRMKQKQVDPGVKGVAKDFMKIDPLRVADHAKYMEYADALMAGMSGSRYDAKNDEIKQRATLNTAEASAYIKKELERQKEVKDELQKRINKELTGHENVSLESIREMEDAQVDELLESGGIEKGSVKDAVKEWIDNARPTVKSMLRGEETTLSDIPVDLTKKQLQIVNRFMNINLDHLTDAQALRVMDGLDSFMTNGTVFGMEHAVKVDEGVMGVQSVKKAGVKGKTFRTIYPGKWVDKVFGEQLTNLPLFIENVFRGRTPMTLVMRASGLRDVINGYSRALGETKALSNKYHAQFDKNSVNGQPFMSQYNVFERGVWAAISRTSNPDAAQSEFETNKNLVWESIEALEAGDAKQKKMAKVYREAYDAVLKDANSIAEAQENIDRRGKVNRQAVEWWVKEWENTAPDLSALTAGVYNRELGLEDSYTPRTWSRVNQDFETKTEVVAELKTSAFDSRTNSMPKKEPGVLMSRRDFVKRPQNRFLDPNFDRNMVSAMEGALMDLNTHPDRVKLEAFMSSPEFNDIFGDKQTADVFKRRVVSYVQDIAGSKKVRSSEAMRSIMPWIQQYAATRALGRSTMAIQQMAPVMLNTIFNAGGFDLHTVLGADATAINAFIDRSGYGIAMRGVESRGDMPTNDELFRDGNMFTKIMKPGTVVSSKILDYFLVNPDKFIARASWLTYYKKGLRKEGVDVKSIDWETHNVNNAKFRKAADYAQDMLDRQQNVSDSALMGEFLKSKSDAHKVIRSTFFVFANFVINQKMRMQTDMVVLMDPNASISDKKISARSFAGVIAEQFAFHALGAAFRDTMLSLTYGIMGREQSEEEKEERRKKSFKNMVQYLSVDLFSPIPALDKILVGGIRAAQYAYGDATDQDMDEVAFNNYGGDDLFAAFGVFGMAAQDMLTINQMRQMAMYGEYRKDYAGNSVKKYLTEHEQELMTTAFLARILHSYGLLPTDFKNLSNNMMRVIDKSAESDAGRSRRMKKQNSRLDEISTKVSVETKGASY